MKYITTTILLAIFTCLSVKTHAQTAKSNTVYTSVEHPPEFPGGDGALLAFIQSNMKYPAAALENHIEGIVFLGFIVEKDGSLSDVKVFREPGSGLGKEAIRIMSKSPRWIAGTQKGMNVRVQYAIPITFKCTPVDTTESEIYTAVEVPPSFPGGDAALDKFLSSHIIYPEQAKFNKISGRVFVSLIVETDGSLSDLRIIRDPGQGLGDEAVRVLKRCPHWTPGIQNGRPVRVAYTIPVNFSLSE